MTRELRMIKPRVWLTISATSVVGFAALFTTVSLNSPTGSEVELAIDESLRFASDKKLLGFRESDCVMRIRGDLGFDRGKRFLFDYTPDGLRPLVIPSFCIIVEDTHDMESAISKGQYGIYEVRTLLRRGVNNVRFSVVLRYSKRGVEVLEVLVFARGE